MPSLRAPIAEVVLEENNNLGLIYPITGLEEFEVYFFRIARRFPAHRTYDEEMPSIAAGDTVDFGYLGDEGIGAGTDLLTIWGERPFRIVHFAFGIMPSDIWLYKAIPAGVGQTGWGYETPPHVGDKRDYVDGYLSPYEEPTLAGETILHNKLSIYVGFKNNSAREVRPKLRLLGAGYDVIPIVKKKFIDKMIAGKIPCRYLTIGGLRTFTYVIPDEWQEPTIVSKEKIEGVMNGS